MTNFAMLCPALPGHLNPMITLGKELKKRGHQITFFQIEDVAEKITQQDLDFYPIGLQDYPRGTLTQFLNRLGELKGVAATRYWHNDHQIIAGIICRELPEAIKTKQIEVLLVDQLEPAAAAVAELLKVPFITICNALALNREPGVPPIFTPWVYQDTKWAFLRNQLFYYLGDLGVREYNKVLAEYRQQWNLPKLKPSELFFANSPLAQVSQQPQAFDFPRQHLPSYFYYTGPWRDLESQNISFPFEKLTGKPLIYASLGTLQISKYEIFHAIAAACQDLDVQLVISHGGGMSEADASNLPGFPLVVSYAPQLKVLEQAKLTITHAGLNTVLDALTQGVPMVAIPIAFEQTAIAARIKWTGVGKVINLNQLNVANLKAAIDGVLKEPFYLNNALRLQQSIADGGGVHKVATIIEENSQ